MCKGNPRLYIRLPKDHWIWEIEDSNKRNETVKEALSFYKKFHTKIEDIKNELADIKKNGLVINDGQTNSSENNNIDRDEDNEKLEKFYNALNQFTDL